MLKNQPRPQAHGVATCAKVSAGEASSRRRARAEQDLLEDSDSGGDNDAFELDCDIRVEQFVTGAVAPNCRQQKQTVLSFHEGVLVARLHATDIRIPMAGPKARVTVHCNQMPQG
jgi:hypothetical protein